MMPICKARKEAIFTLPIKNVYFKSSPDLVQSLFGVIAMKLFFSFALFVTICCARPDRQERSRNGNPEDSDYEYDEKGKGVYAKMDQIVYPFQQYTQVRHSYSVEHLPMKESEPNPRNEDETSSSNSVPIKKPTKMTRNKNAKNLMASASNNGEEKEYEEDEEIYKPRLREEIENYKKQEVYEEKGYADGAYDHGQYEENRKEAYPTRDSEGESSRGYQRDSGAASSSSKPIHLSTLPTSTKILEYAASHYDKAANEKGIYAARENIHCPEVIDFDLSSKKMKMGKGGRGGKKPRLGGLGGKIKCLKEKYFGQEPLPRHIFMEPSESRHSAIQIPTFQNFYNEFKEEFRIPPFNF